MNRPSLIEVTLRQQELRREAAEARMAVQARRSTPRESRSFRPFGLRLAPAR